MSRRSTFVGAAAFLAVFAALLVRAVTVHSVAGVPLIYRTIVNQNDLDGVEGQAPPGSWVELWVRQRNFIEGTAVDPDDRFAWCKWKNQGNAVRIGGVTADHAGTFRMTGLRRFTTVTLFPSAPDPGRCPGGIYTELLPRVCTASGCTAWQTPKLEYLNINRPSDRIARATGSVVLAEQAALAVADGPDTGTAWGNQNDVDQSAVDTTFPGYVVGQRVRWRCGAGGTAVCPSTTVHDSSTIVEVDVEYPYVLGTMQAHRYGGSFFAAVATPRRQPLGPHFTVDVNVKFRGKLDINLGCDPKMNFNFSRGLQF